MVFWGWNAGSVIYYTWRNGQCFRAIGSIHLLSNFQLKNRNSQPVKGNRNKKIESRHMKNHLQTTLAVVSSVTGCSGEETSRDDGAAMTWFAELDYFGWCLWVLTGPVVSLIWVDETGSGDEVTIAIGAWEVRSDADTGETAFGDVPPWLPRAIRRGLQ